VWQDESMEAQRVGKLATGAFLGLTIALTLSIGAGADTSSGHVPLPSVAPYFGTAPQNCPVASSKLIHSARQGLNIWVGSGRLVGYSGWYIANHRLALGFGDRTRYGYPQKIFWQLTRGARGPIALTGWNLRTNQRMWFGEPLPQAHPKALVPPPVIAWPSGLVRNHFVHGASAPSLTFVPSAGCYVLQAHWPGGGWSMPFAAGG
jgi:hypothetical protein